MAAARPVTGVHRMLYGADVCARYHRDGHWGKRLMVDHVDDHARRTPDKVAIIEAARSLTYAQVAAMTENVAAHLLELGVEHGDVVAVQAPNWAELPIIHLATDRIGAVFVPLSEGFREKELQHLLLGSGARVVFCPATVKGSDHAAFMRGVAASCPQVAHVIPMRDAGDAVSFDAVASSSGWRSRHGSAWLEAARASADAPSHVMVSSGSTGLPRCSLFSDNNTLVKLRQQYVEAAEVTSTDIAAALAPAGTGSTGYNYPILAMLLLGGTSVLLEHWSGTRVQDAIELMARHACTVAVAVPAQLARLVAVASTAPPDARLRLRVITNSGAKLAPSLAAAAERLFGCKVQSIYGSSEAGATAMTRVRDSDEKRTATVGRPLSGQEVRIAADDGAWLGSGAVGEVCWRGANKSYGFLNDEEGTARVWDAEGWMHSGDLGCIDPEGYLSIVGRKKDMIIRGGQNVNPGAIEEVLIAHPSIADVAVVAFDDEVLGERIAACVVTSDALLTLDALKAMVLERGLAAWHQPELLVRLAELPRNAGGKVDKKSLTLLATAASRGAAVTASAR